MATTIKESALPSKTFEPFRIEGVGRFTDIMDLSIEYMQISYPFNHVLEQKTDAASQVKTSNHY